MCSVRCFNSLQVRYKPVIQPKISRAVVMFQFLIGTLQTQVILLEFFFPQISFNSLQVRYKRFFSAHGKRSGKFQFLIGTLQLMNFCQCYHLFHGFQFFIGTLQTRSRFRLVSQVFQFLIGTLQTNTDYYIIGTYRAFQFFIGTLQTRERRHRKKG